MKNEWVVGWDGVVLDQLWIWGPKVVGSVLVFLGFYVLSKIIKRVIIRNSQNIKLDENITRIITKISVGGVLIFGIISALGTLGMDISAIVAGLGLTGFAFGFALKDTIGNTLSGIIILLYKPFVVGDRVSIVKYDGIVVSIDLRYTELKSGNDKFLIPNKKLFTDPITVFGTDVVDNTKISLKDEVEHDGGRWGRFVGKAWI